MTANPNSPGNRLKRKLTARWSSEDYPGAEPRFQIALLAQDLAVFILLPVAAIILFKFCEGTPNSSQKRQVPIQRHEQTHTGPGKSQIIDFKSALNGSRNSILSGISKKSPGSLVKLKLLNVVETYSTAPVHAQILDASLGNNLTGGILIGDAIPDTTFERINITFRYARDPNRDNVAVPISARALSLDGTLGVVATKKEGFFARSAFNSAGTVSQHAQNTAGNVDFKEVLFRALTAGLAQEFGSESQVERNRSQVLTLQPSTEFFAELTDFFPGGTK